MFNGCFSPHNVFLNYLNNFMSKIFVSNTFETHEPNEKME